jgi:hypothetical protein
MRAFLLGATCLALSVPACSDSTNQPGDPDIADPDDQQDQGPDETDPVDPPTPDESARDYSELAQILGAHVRGEFAIQLATAAISEGRYPEGFYSTGDGAGAGVLGSMNFSFTYHCNNGDAAHTIVPCDGTAHHSHFQLAMNGTETVGSLSMDMLNRQVDWEIRDLLVDKARFRGPDNISVATSVTTDGVTATYTLNADAIYEQVRFMPAAVIPTFGTIDFAINVERVRGDDRRVFTVNAQLAYGASGVPTTLTLDGAVAYSVNLTTGELAKL